MSTLQVQAIRSFLFCFVLVFFPLCSIPDTDYRVTCCCFPIWPNIFLNALFDFLPQRLPLNSCQTLSVQIFSVFYSFLFYFLYLFSFCNLLTILCSVFFLTLYHRLSMPLSLSSCKPRYNHDCLYGKSDASERTNTLIEYNRSYFSKHKNQSTLFLPTSQYTPQK